MSAESGPKVALVGMAGTGKTTFVAAIWNLIQEPLAKPTMTLNRRPLEGAYLDDIHRAWVHREEVGHTPRDKGELISLEITLNGREFILDLPDLSGESFEEMFTQRTISEGIDFLLSAADGLLVFVHPDHLRTRVTIINAAQLGANLGEGATAPRQFDLKELPAEVQTVDLLQTIRGRRRTNHSNSPNARTAILISAWDVIANEGLAPAEWVRARMPMLDQYLVATESDNPFRIYGVSAQGMSYEDQHSEAIDPVTRAYVVEPDGKQHNDLSSPVAWVGDHI